MCVRRYLNMNQFHTIYINMKTWKKHTQLSILLRILKFFSFLVLAKMTIHFVSDFPSF